MPSQCNKSIYTFWCKLNVPCSLFDSFLLQRLLDAIKKWSDLWIVVPCCLFCWNAINNSPWYYISQSYHFSLNGFYFILWQNISFLRQSILIRNHRKKLNQFVANINGIIKSMVWILAVNSLKNWQNLLRSQNAVTWLASTHLFLQGLLFPNQMKQLPNWIQFLHRLLQLYWLKRWNII